MEKDIKILFVDDHLLILKGFLSMFKESESFNKINVVIKTSGDEALQTVKNALETDPFDIVFTDLSFNTTTNTIHSGETLIKELKKAAPNLKIGVITGHSETNRIYNVITNLNPLAYILKDSCNLTELNFAIERMLNDEVYYSHIVHQKILKRSIIQISMDEIALQILEELPKHPKIGNLVGHIVNSNGKLLQIRSIEKKLSDLRISLNAQNNTDLVLKAKELGVVD
ncbi:response regulator [uncultured Polaribacter sp.]|uniref:response regulator n=1 Tax=uncultured Polaribacter sp. TaxID=174711 RepID=UPI00262C3239|nr:response regulator [uncultured Polaribacter sp.]